MPSVRNTTALERKRSNQGTDTLYRAESVQAGVWPVEYSNGRLGVAWLMAGWCEADAAS